MPCSGCSALHGVNPNLKKKKQTKGQPGYNPKKKRDFTYEKLVENFCNIWLPCKNIAIDEKVGFTLNVIMQTNQTNMGLRTLKYVIHLMRTAVC